MEKNRLEALGSYHILDTIEEQDFDQLTALSAAIFQVPISLITFVDQKRQWFKSHLGMEERESPVEYSFCAHAIKTPDDVFIVENAQTDERFLKNPLVTGDPNIAFYAGVPLVTSGGYPLGALCIIDRVPRTLLPGQIEALKILGNQVMDKLELRKKNFELHQSNVALEQTNEKLRVSEENLVQATEELEDKVNKRTTALSAINQRLEIALAAGNFGSYEVDLATGMMITSDQCRRNYGQSKDKIFNFPDLLNVIEPDYREYLQDRIQHAITNVTAYHVEYQIRWPDDTIHWMAVSGRPQYDDEGKAVKLFGVTFDISSKKETEEKINALNAKLVESNNRFRQLIQASPVALLVTRGDDMIFEEFNQAVLNMVGKDQSIKGKPWFEAIPELKGQAVLSDLYHTYRTGEALQLEQVPITMNRNGEPYKGYYSISYTPLVENGIITGVLQSVVDNTLEVNSRKEIEHLYKELTASNEEVVSANEELAATNEELAVTNEELTATKNELELTIEILAGSESRFRGLVQEAPVAMFILRGRDMVFETVNDLMYRMLGKDSEIIGKAYAEAVPELVGQPFFKILDDVFKSGETFYGNEIKGTLNINGKLTEGYFNFIYQAIKNDAGEVTGVMCVAVNVVEQVNSRAALANANERLNVALNAGNFGTTEVDLATGHMVSNERFKTLFGRHKDEDMQYTDMFEAMLPRYREYIKARSKKAQAEHSLYAETYEIAWPDGSIHWIEAHGRARYDKDGNPDRMVGILADVTDQVTARIQLERAESNLRLATEAAALGSWYINAETLEFYPSNRLKELFGYHPDEKMPYEAAVDQIVPSHRDQVTAAVNAAVNKGKSYEIDYPIIGFHNKKLRWVRATGRLFAAEAGQPAHFSGVMVDITNQVAATKALQESEEKLRIAIDTGKMGTWSIDTVTLKTTLSEFVRNILGIPPEVEATMDMILSAIKPAYHEMLTETLKNAVENGQSSDSEYEIVNLRTGEEKWVKSTATVLLDTDGKPAEYTGIFMDITERKLDELRKNDFIGMVSHELKTPLTSLNAYLQMLHLKAKKAGDSFTSGALDQSLKQVKRMTTMINGFLNMSRLESGKISIDKQAFDMSALIKESEAEARPIYSSHTLVFDAVKEITVVADRDKIGQVINNFISNAVKYSKAGSTVTIACAAIDGSVVVSVKDKGIGIEKKEIDKLFERYYRVEGNTHISGFGIGLYLCFEIIERHHGKIWAESKPCEGSTFYFSLPLMRAAT